MRQSGVVTRIIGGVAGGRRLSVPPRGTRPTSDRVREALFSALDHEVGDWSGCRALDLYAGSGALGLEAVSRGAEAVVLVERDRAAVEVIRRNAAAVAVGEVRVLTGDVERVTASPPADDIPTPVNLVFLDPPYAVENSVVSVVLGDLATHGWLAPDAVVVVERQSGSEALTWPTGFDEGRTRRYGDTALWFGYWNPA